MMPPRPNPDVPSFVLRAYAFPGSAGIFVALLVLAIYLPARANGFVWDDWSVLDVFWTTGLRHAGTWTGLSHAGTWLDALLRPPDDHAVLFRPLTMLTILLQIGMGHSGPQPYHIVNVVIHAANVFLLTLVAWHLVKSEGISTATRCVLVVACGLFYGLHPALTEPVVWISARSDLLLTFFLCIALLVDRALSEPGWMKALAISACFFLAMLAKETAVGFLVAIPLVHLAVSWQQPGRLRWSAVAEATLPHYRTYASLLGATVLYLATRLTVGGPAAFVLDDAISPARHIGTVGQHALVVLSSIAWHVASALWPFQNVVPGRQVALPISLSDVLPMLAASFGVILAAVAAIFTGSAARAPAILFLAFVASLVPVANIVPIPAVVVPSEIVVANRYLTFPLVFACLSVPFFLRMAHAALMKHVRHAGAIIAMAVAAWLMASGFNVRVTIPLWKDDLVLNTWAIRQGGESFWRYANIGAYYLLTGDYSHAREAFLISVRLRNDNQTAWIWNNLGTAEAALGNHAEAKRAFLRALELGSDEMRSRLNIGRLERSIGNAEAAVEVLEQGLFRVQKSGRSMEHEAELRYELALAYWALGRPEDAAAQLNAARARARNARERQGIDQALRTVGAIR
jgi:hypothetical protein